MLVLSGDIITMDEGKVIENGKKTLNGIFQSLFNSFKTLEAPKINFMNNERGVSYALFLRLNFCPF